MVVLTIAIWKWTREKEKREGRRGGEKKEVAGVGNAACLRCHCLPHHDTLIVVTAFKCHCQHPLTAAGSVPRSLGA